MAQDLTVNIKTTSDVPQAMDRAKGATVSFGKQVDDIQKKFSMAFKDVFLSFLGPLALLGIAMNYIGKLIDENRKKHEDANQAAIDGTNALMSAEDKYYANKRNNEKKAKQTVEEAKTTREDVTKSFLTTDPRGRKMLFEFADEQRKLGTNKIGPGYASEDKAMQERVQKLIAEDAKKNPLPVDKKEATTFKTPEGFSNVVGVGSNPVMEAMAEQTELQRQQLDELKKLNAKETGAPIDFTKQSK
jgi:delta 1-pyrroline-5-carboxylate dehydrogenase